MTLANRDGAASWELEYSFRDYFELPESEAISATSLAGIMGRIYSEDAMFKKYYSANTVRFEEASEETCNATCHVYHYCAMSEQDYGRYEDCILQGLGEVTTPAPGVGATLSNSLVTVSIFLIPVSYTHLTLPTIYSV